MLACGVTAFVCVCVSLVYCRYRRFDLIFLMLDPQDEAFDHRLATHLVSLYHQSKEMAEEEDLVCCVGSLIVTSGSVGKLPVHIASHDPRTWQL